MQTELAEWLGDAWRFAALASAVAFAASCSRDMTHAPDPVPSDLEALYRSVREYRHDYERGIELIIAGEDVAGLGLLNASSNRLRVAARLCADTPGCDAALFNDTLGHVFTDRRAAHGRQSEPRTDDAGFILRAGDEESPVVAIIQELGRTLDMLHGRDLRELIPWNERVKAAIHDWLTWKRPQLVEAWENYQFLRAKIAPIYHEAGLPEALLFAMIAKESAGKVHAYSRAGAAGPLQFMPRTARRYGLVNDDGFDLRLDPEAATRANVRYLNDQFEIFNHDLEKTLAAYNVGETKLRRLERRHGGVEFWDPNLLRSLPRETRSYVPQVLAAAWLFLHPDDYGLAFPEFETGTTTIVLDESISLGELTICLGDERKPDGWFRTLRNLNPRADSTGRLPAGSRIEMPSMLVPVYAERCVGESELLRRAREVQNARHPDRKVPGGGSSPEARDG